VLKLALSLRDYSREIISGKLVFLLETDLHSLPWKNIPHLILHPVLGPVYEEEQRWWKKVSQLNRSAPIKCLVNTHGLLSRDVIDTFLEMGISAFPLDVISLHPKQIASQIKKTSPDFVFTINYVKGLPEICAETGTFLVIWEIDPTIELLSENDLASRAIHENTFIYTYRKKRVDYFRSLGFRKVKFLPLATNTRRYHPIGIEAAQEEKYGADVSYVGNSMYHQAQWTTEKIFNLLRQQNCPDSIDEKLKYILEQQVKNSDFFYFPKLAQKILDEVGCPLIVNDETGRKIDVVLGLSEKIASERRFQAINSLEEFAKNRTVRVWGDDGWENGLARSIIYSGPAGHFHELPIIYNASRINLDINRIYQRDIVPLRIFDILACGAFVLAEDSRELGRFFKKGEEIISYRKISQIPEICSYYLNHEAERKEIAARGRQRVLKEHTLEHRLSTIIDDVKNELRIH
jgi:spore maturation protein CgeB